MGSQLRKRYSNGTRTHELDAGEKENSTDKNVIRCGRKSRAITQQGARLQRHTAGVDVLDQLAEHVRLKLLDDQRLVLLAGWLSGLDVEETDNKV